MSHMGFEIVQPKRAFRIATGTKLAHIEKLQRRNDGVYSVSTLCGGMQSVVVVNAATREWPADPFAEVINLGDTWATPCLRCQKSYDAMREYAAANSP